MSSFLEYVSNGEYHKEIESMEICKWRINDVCCNDKCEFLADFPYPREICDINNDKRCKYFEKEE